jgi:hypothetical protein
MISDTHYRVLVLDDTTSAENAQFYNFDTLNTDRPIRVITQHTLGSANQNEYSEDKVHKEIKQTTESNDGGYDLIIVSGDCKDSILKVLSISFNVYGRTIIVWKQFEPGKEKPFKSLGLQSFSSKANLFDLIPTLLPGVTKNVA